MRFVPAVVKGEQVFVPLEQTLVYYYSNRIEKYTEKQLRASQSGVTDCVILCCFVYEFFMWVLQMVIDLPHPQGA